MSTSRVRLAISEAKRFIERAEAALLVHQRGLAGAPHDQMYQSKENASAKRASLDLSRDEILIAAIERGGKRALKFGKTLRSRPAPVVARRQRPEAMKTNPIKGAHYA